VSVRVSKFSQASFEVFSFENQLTIFSLLYLLRTTDAFSAIRAAAANLINQRSDGSKIETTQSLLVALRTSAKSSLELRRAPDMQSSALRVVEYIEKLWVAAEQSELGVASFSEKVSRGIRYILLVTHFTINTLFTLAV